MKKSAGDIIILHMCTKKRDRDNFAILGHFFPFQPPDNPENQNFKIEKNTMRYYNFTHFHHKWQSYDVWFLRNGAQQTKCFVILDHFLPFNSPMDQENQNFQKIHNTPEDIIILQMRTINDSHMMCGSWDMKCNRQNFLSFWVIFCPFTLLTSQKIKILKKWKKVWCYHFTHVYHKWQSHDVWVPEIWSVTDTTLCHYDWQPKKLKFWKIETNALRYYHFTHVYHKLQWNDVWFLRYWMRQTDFFCHLGPFFALLPP